MKTSKQLFFLIGFCLTTICQAQVAEYLFCVKSDTYESFKARVVFKGLDFGENSARQMVLNDLNEVLEGEFSLSRDSTDCPCRADCPQVEVNSDNWRERFKKGEGDIKTIWGNAVEVGDAVISEGRALWDNPGEFLMTRILGQKKD